jgi:hypothetical protein
MLNPHCFHCRSNLEFDDQLFCGACFEGLQREIDELKAEIAKYKEKEKKSFYYVDTVRNPTTIKIEHDKIKKGIEKFELEKKKTRKKAK